MYLYNYFYGIYHFIDTIPGRQCMASFLFLRNEFENALVYLTSIKVMELQYSTIDTN